MKIKKGDQVAIITGKDRGKRGEVLRVFPAQNRVIVKGANLMKRHRKPSGGGAGERISIEAPLDLSNVMLIDPSTDKPTRVRFEERGEEKVRVGKKSGKVI
jgi:large subunit ribosomal protein L24